MKILLADDHELFIDGLKLVLQELEQDIEFDINIDGQSVLDKLLSGENYDLALIDLKLPVQNGFSILSASDKASCTIPIIIISSTMDPNDAKKAIDYGAVGFIPKSASKNKMLGIIKWVLMKDVNSTYGEFAEVRISRKNQIWAKWHNVTPRQMDIINLLMRGSSNEEIAKKLSISLSTVKSHCTAIFKKFDTKSRVETIKKVRLYGFE